MTGCRIARPRAAVSRVRRGGRVAPYLLIVLSEYILADESAGAWTQTIIDALALLDFDGKT